MQVQLGIGLTVTDEAMEHLIDKGYDEKYGARPLRRTIQNLVEDRMAEEMLDGRIKAGSSVEVGYDGEKLVFRVKSKRTSGTKRTGGNKPEAGTKGGAKGTSRGKADSKKKVTAETE